MQLNDIILHILMQQNFNAHLNFLFSTHFHFRIGFIFRIAGKKGQINFCVSTKSKIVLVIVNYNNTTDHLCYELKVVKELQGNFCLPCHKY